MEVIKVDIEEILESFRKIEADYDTEKEYARKEGCKCKVYPFSGKITRWCYTCGKMICNNCGDGYQCPECRYDIKETNKETYGGWCEEFNT